MIQKGKKELYSPVVTVPKNAWQRRADEIHNSLASGENQRLQTPHVVKYPNYDVSVKAPIDKPAKEDDFLAGFNYYSDEPEKVTPVSSAPVTKKEAPVVKAERYSEKQEVPQNRNEKFARIRANADKRTWVDGKVVEEPKEDEFFAGFNEAENEEKKEREALQKRNEAHARARANADKALDTVKIADDVVDNIKAVDKATDALKTADTAVDGIKTAETLKLADEVADFTSFPKTIHNGKQGKHIVGHNNYVSGKSIVTASTDRLQELIKKHSGVGISVGKNKEVVDFGEVIGKYVDPKTGKAYDTTIGTIHYSKSGVHIVPGRPKKWRY